MIRTRRFAIWVILALCAVGLYVFGKVNGGFFSWFLFYVFVVGLLYEWITGLVALRGASIRIIAPKRVVAGDDVDLGVVVLLRGVWPVFWLRIHDLLPSKWRTNADYVKSFQVPLWRREVKFRYVVKAVPRGVFRMDDGTIESGDLLGLNRVRRSFSSASVVVVYPKTVRIRNWNPVGALPDGEQRSIRQWREDLNDVIGARPYANGDRMHHIHWPVTARFGRLHVKEFEGHVSTDFIFVPDCSRVSYRALASSSAIFELAMQTTASLVQYTSRSGRNFGMIVGADRYLEIPVGAPGSVFERCMDILAGMEPNQSRDFVDVLAHIHQRDFRGATLVMVTPRLDREVALAMAKMRRQSALSVFVPHLNGSSQRGSSLEIERLRAMGVVVHSIASIEDLSSL